MAEKLTKSDIKKIQEEIMHRRLVVRKEAIQAVKVARAHGDLSENFEYYAARKDNGANESRIKYLERMLKYATVVDEDSNTDEVGMNNTVEILIVEDNEIETYRLVTSIREDSLAGLISIESPLGKALLGRKVGEKVHVKVRDGFGYDVVINKIVNTNDETEDKIKRF
jgi:transcription elongation factor GreA